MSDDCGTVGPGGIRFYDNVVPTLGVGDYLVNVTQRVNPQGSGIDESWAASQAFSVQGPRYALPPDDVFSVFPPPNAQGQFDQSMPNVVFTQRDLPWERNVFNDPDRATQTPWMALLLFVEGEQIGGEDALLPPLVSGWTPNPTVSAVIPAAQFYDDHPADQGILWPALESEWYESADYLQSTGTTIIDVSPGAFQALVPGAEDLRFLAHGRQVDPSAKDAQVLGVTGDGWYSVVIAPRLPDPPPEGSPTGQRNIVHLVSLEGLEQYVGGVELPGGTTRVRMISLQSWTFTCMAEEGESFAELMQGLLVDEAGMPRSTTFSLPYDTRQVFTPEQHFAAQALAGGYAPLRWQTRLGEQSYAWYRGPFTPVPVAQWVDPVSGETGAPPVFGTASAAMIYDRAYGVFDLSYAVAWETGRLQALADPWFAQALTAWQRAGHALTNLLMERRRQAALSASAPGAPPPPRTVEEVLASARAYAWTGGFVPHLVTTLGAASSTVGEPVAIAADPSDPGSPDYDPSTAESTGSTESTAAAEPGEPGDSTDLAPGATAEPAEIPPAQQPIDSGAYTPPPPAYPPHPTKEGLEELLSDPAVQAAIRAAAQEAIDPIAAWLAQRYLLVGVPFETLVPRSELLEPETVRFFWIDANWQEALLQGALSIGLGSTRDAAYQALNGDVIRAAAQQAVPRIRAALAGTPPADDSPPQPPVAGMLLRSAAVTGWPGMEVRGYAKFTTDSAGDVLPDLDSEVTLLRLDRLSSDVMVCLWADLPAVVTIAEPAEGIAFGFEDPPSGEGDWLYLRSVDPSDYGMPLCTGSGPCAYTVDAMAKQIIDPVTRVVKITGTGGAVEAIQAVLPGNPTLQVRDFAVQMVKVPEQAVFAAPPAASPTADSSGEPSDVATAASVATTAEGRTLSVSLASESAQSTGSTQSAESNQSADPSGSSPSTGAEG